MRESVFLQMEKLFFSLLKFIKRILKGRVLLHLVVILIFYLSLSPNSPLRNLKNKSPAPLNPYVFDNPDLAYRLLKYFDEFEPVNPKYYNSMRSTANRSNEAYMGLHIDEAYCDKHRAQFVKFPKFIFKQTHTMFDHWPKHSFRAKIIPGILNDLQPGVSSKVNDKTERISWIDPHQLHFNTVNFLHLYLHVGKNFACITQSYNHIPGAGHLNRKDLVSESTNIYAKNYMNRPQCFSYEKRFPKTWVMYLEDQCKDFFKNFQSEKYSQLKASNGVVYIRKIGAGSHNAKGVFPMNDEEESYVKTLYENGEKCGAIDENYVIQYFIPNPLLLFNRKFHFRIYMMIASVNPLIVYYHDGYAKLSLNEYEAHSNDKYSLISNVLMANNKSKNLYHGMTKQELQYFQRFELDVFQKHLLDQGIVTDPKFVENHIKPEFKKTMIHLMRMTQDKLLKRSQIFELFGVDFIMDQDLSLWFIECNSSPSLEPTYPETEIFIKKLIKDLYEIIMGLTRSRTKRILKFINELTKQKEINFDAEGNPSGLEEMKKEFQRLIQNKFEPEFLPSQSNRYELIIDENLEGPARYMGLLSEECI